MTRGVVLRNTAGSEKWNGTGHRCVWTAAGGRGEQLWDGSRHGACTGEGRDIWVHQKQGHCLSVPPNSLSADGSVTLGEEHLPASGNMGREGNCLQGNNPPPSALGWAPDRPYLVHTEHQEELTLCIFSETIINNSAIYQVAQSPCFYEVTLLQYFRVYLFILSLQGRNRCDVLTKRKWLSRIQDLCLAPLLMWRYENYTHTQISSAPCILGLFRFSAQKCRK